MIFVPFSFISESKEDLILSGDTIKVRIVEVNKETRSVVGAPSEPFGGLILPDPSASKRNRNNFNRRR